MKKLILISLFLITVIQARHDFNGSGPLFQPYSVTLKGGIAPAFFSNKGAIFPAVRDFTPLVFEAGKEPNFNQMWHNYPVNIAFDFGFALSNHIELFGEFNYRYAKAKDFSFEGFSPFGQFGVVTPKLDSFQAFAGYSGSRYFFNRIFCDKLSFFLGGKFGLVNYREVSAKPLTIVNQFNQTLVQNTTWFESTIVPSGGFQLGFDILATKSFSLFFNAEIVATSALKSKFNFIKEDQAIFPSFTNLLREAPRTVLSFPVTLGLRYYFGCN